jgi:hypothetical protein
MKRILLLGAAATVAGAFAVPALAATPAAAPPHPTHITVIAHGLANPRGVVIEHDGTILVSEAGRGGYGPCIPAPEGPGNVCFGLSSSLTAIAHGRQHRIVTGLPSLGDEGTGANAVGLDNTTLTPSGIVGIIGLGASPATRATFGKPGKLLATVVGLRPGKPAWRIADLAAYEEAHNPDAGDPGSSKDTDPYDIQWTSHGLVAADAGGNTLLNVGRKGHVTTAAVLHARLVDAPPSLGLPPGTQIPMQAVPTSVVQGPDGALYAGQLTGFPFPVGGANVYRIVPGHEPTVFASGFTNIIDIAFDHAGNLYVLEITKTGLLSGGTIGALIKVDHAGHRTEIAEDQLVSPGGMALAHDGSIYVSVNSTDPKTGQVVRIQP